MKLKQTNYHFSLALILLILSSFLLNSFNLPRLCRQSFLFSFLQTQFKPRVINLIQPLSFVDLMAEDYRDQQWLMRAYFKSQAELVELANLKKENQSLRSLLKVKDTWPENSLIVKPVYSLSQPLIAAGKAEGVKPGSLVFGQGVLLGIVSQVEPHLAYVRLLGQDHQLVILAKTQSGVTGLVRLVHNQLHLTEIPPNLTLKLNEPVLTVGQPGIPGGLLIGLVADTGKTTANATYAVRVKQGISFYNEAVVQVRP